MRDDIADVVAGGCRDVIHRLCAAQCVSCRRSSRRFRFKGDVVDEVMHLKGVAAGENSLRRRLIVLVDDGTAGYGVDDYSGFAGKLVFRDKTDGKQQRIAGYKAFRRGDRAAVFVDLGDLTPSNFFAEDIGHGMRKHERNIKIVEALSDVARKPAAVIHNFGDALDLGALEGKAARHDKPDIAGT